MDIVKSQFLTNCSKTKLTQLKGITIESLYDLYFTPNQSYLANGLNSAWDITGELNKDIGTHFVLDEFNIIQYVDTKYKVNHIKKMNPTYISNSLYNGNPNDYTIGIMILFPLGQNYIEIERRAILFIGDFLKENHLTTDNMWRAYDLNRECSPMQYLNKLMWEKFVEEVDKYIINSRKKGFIKSKYIVDSIWKSDQELRNFLKQNMYNYANQQNIDDRGIKAALEKNQTQPDKKVVTTNHNSDIIYSSQEQKNDESCNCNKEYNGLDSSLNTKTFNVEPIYPDTIVPPGTSSVSFNASDNAKSQETVSKTIPSVDDYTKRQSTFDYTKHKNATKEDRGKPVNNNDPYPIDKKIDELENHHPKVKIDDIILKLADCNHPGCDTGKSLMKVALMLSDAVTDQSKRVERRLVLLENILSTILRYVGRISSRVPINCVYYGGQDIFGKYKCIRCLHTDRINDGQSMTIDQCINCSRYEPIIGQIYDILDDSGLNLSAILDDSQMSYMDMNDYSNLNRVEEMNTSKKDFDFSNTRNTNNTIQQKVKELEEKYQKEKEDIYFKYAQEQADNAKNLDTSKQEDYTTTQKDDSTDK